MMADNTLSSIRKFCYTEKDLINTSDGFSITIDLFDKPIVISGSDPESVVAMANDYRDQHLSVYRFLATWREGVSLAPEYFNVVGSIQDASSLSDLKPDFPSYVSLLKDSRSNLIFISLMWSFFNLSYLSQLIDHFSSASLADLIDSLDADMRKIISELFLTCPAHIE